MIISRRVLLTELREVWPAVLIVLAAAGAGAWYLYATRSSTESSR